MFVVDNDRAVALAKGEVVHAYNVAGVDFCWRIYAETPQDRVAADGNAQLAPEPSARLASTLVADIYKCSGKATRFPGPANSQLG